MAHIFDTTRPVDSFRVTWSDSHVLDENSAAGKRKRRAVPSSTWINATREQRRSILTVHTEHKQLCSTLDEARALSEEKGPNAWMQVKYSGNKVFVLIGRAGFLYSKAA